MIILLDLNFTLVANSHEKHSPFVKQIEKERYRTDLIEAIKHHRVILMTARPGNHRQATLRSIEEKTGWHPDDAFFNDYRQPPPVAKRMMLERGVLDMIGDEPVLAIESNPRTRTMFAKYGIPAMTYKEFIHADPGKLDV